MSLAHRVPSPSLATWLARRGPDWGSSRALLPRLLLDADGASVRRRIDEPRLGRRDCAVRSIGKDRTMGRLDKQAYRPGTRRLGRGHPGPDDFKLSSLFVIGSIKRIGVLVNSDVTI